MSLPQHFSLRNSPACLGLITSGLASPAMAELMDLEKDAQKLGFIKLTDIAPLAVAYERGFFADEGLYVSLEAQANWKVLLDAVMDGQLDGAHIITPFSMDLNGNSVTLSNAVREEMNLTCRW